MALRKLGNFGRSVFFRLESELKKGQELQPNDVSVFKGFLVGVKHVEKKKNGKAKGGEEFTFLLMQEKDTKDAEIVSVASGGQLNWLVLDKETQEVKKELLNVWMEIIYKGKQKVEGYPQPLKQFDVSVDFDRKAQNVAPF
jgi:hypothetical protein